MPDDKVRATDKPGIANKATPSRGTSGSGSPAASEPEPIILKVPREAGEDEVFNRLLKALGMQMQNLKLGQDPYYGLALLKNFKIDLSWIMRDARNRSNKNVITLHFTPQKGSTRKDLRIIPNRLFTLRIQHEGQVENERRAEEKRHEDVRRIDREREESRATTARLAAARERERQAAEQKIKMLAVKITSQTMFWNEGTVVGSYVNGDFKIQYHPFSEHQYPSLAVDHANSALIRQQLEDTLWEAYRSPGITKVIYQKPIYSEANAPPFPTQASNTTDEDVIAGLVEHRRDIAGQMIQEVRDKGEELAAVAEDLNPFSPANMAMSGAGIAIKGGKAAYLAAKATKATRRSVNAARWGKTGAELIERAIKERYTISKSFGTLPANYQVHHIVPVTLLENSEVVQAAVAHGFEFNSKVNAIPLPRIVHMANHNKYTELIKDRLER